MTAAVLIVHWPGKDVPSCLLHAMKLEQLGRAFGISVSATAVLDDVECANCLNEAAKTQEAK